MASTVEETTYAIKHTEKFDNITFELREYTGPYLPKPLFYAYRYQPLEREVLEEVATLRAGHKLLRKWRMKEIHRRAQAVAG